jgi:hypothetical protein
VDTLKLKRPLANWRKCYIEGKALALMHHTTRLGRKQWLAALRARYGIVIDSRDAA